MHFSIRSVMLILPFELVDNQNIGVRELVMALFLLVYTIPPFNYSNNVKMFYVQCQYVLWPKMYQSSDTSLLWLKCYPAVCLIFSFFSLNFIVHKHFLSTFIMHYAWKVNAFICFARYSASFCFYLDMNCKYKASMEWMLYVCWMKYIFHLLW